MKVAPPEAEPVVIAKGGDPCDGGEAFDAIAVPQPKGGEARGPLALHFNQS